MSRCGSMKRSADDGAAGPSSSLEPLSKAQKGSEDAILDPDFEGLRGQLLVEAIFKKYGVGTMTIPWLNEDTKERNIRPHPVNRPVMESLAEAYTDRILTSGLNVDCSGRAVVQKKRVSQSMILTMLQF